MIRAIGFDYLGVTARKPEGNVFARVAEAAQADRNEIYTAYRNHNRRFQIGQMERNLLWQRVLEELEREQYLPQVLEVVANEAPQEDEEVIAYAESLRSRGFKVGVLTNLAGEWAQRMRESNYMSRFDTVLTSEETGLAKPHPGAYRRLAEELDVRTDELLFIDDREESLAGVETLGVTPVLFRDLEQLKRELEPLLSSG